MKKKKAQKQEVKTDIVLTPGSILTVEDIKKFWTLCGWRIEEKGDKAGLHHPDCKCNGQGETCLCLNVCNKPKDIAVIYMAAQNFVTEQLRGIDTKPFLDICVKYPTIQLAIIKAVLEHSKLTEKIAKALVTLGN